MRRHCLALLGPLILSSPVLAEEAGTAAPRYALGPSDDGFVRLDTETGAISHCSKRAEVWRCDTLAVEDPLASRARIDALAVEVKALSAKVDALAARLDAAQESSGVAVLTPEEEKQIDRAMGFSETLMRRFFGLVRSMKEEAEGGG